MLFNNLYNIFVCVQATSVQKAQSSPPSTPATTAPTTMPLVDPATRPASSAIQASTVLVLVYHSLQGLAREAGTAHWGLGLTSQLSLAMTQGSPATALLRASAASAWSGHSAPKGLTLRSPAQLGLTAARMGCPTSQVLAKLAISAAVVPPSPTLSMKRLETSAHKATTALRVVVPLRHAWLERTPVSMATRTAVTACRARRVSTAQARVLLPLRVTAMWGGSAQRA